MGQRITKVRVKQYGSYGAAIPIGVESTNVTMVNGIGLEDSLNDIRNSIPVATFITQTNYNNLPIAQKTNGTFYFVS